MDGEIGGNGLMGDVTVESAIWSRTSSNLAASPMYTFASVVDNLICSSRICTESNLGASPFHSFTFAVDNAIRSRTASNLTTIFSSTHDFGASPLHGFASAEDIKVVAAQLLSNVRRHVAMLFTLAEIKAATGDFSYINLIGGGRFGVVYKGKLVDGREVAIKKGYARSKRMGRVKSELTILSCHLPHKHLVGVVGYCQEENERLLVYEYMKNGSLYDHLHGKNKRDKGSSVLNSWKMRIKVALEASWGIQHLHNNNRFTYIHRDIKSSNILLDETWTAKVSDFLPLIEALGIVGYIDPEYYGRNVLKTKSDDVYGLGVVMLELLTGKRAIFKYGEDGSTPLLRFVEGVKHAILAKDLVKILDPNVEPPDVYEESALEIMSNTSIRCVSLERRNRPTMTEIVLNLERALAICNSISNP
ncbi:hypothetical protein VNO78_21163 [Psophocarpus tetragonolobus]|uniref:Protein kinase domain-containing protein n=1 Tax=Psophocarpus tetragonolobus TaxID=3891 RepID=A0AAN9SB54_PSOTE